MSGSSLTDGDPEELIHCPIDPVHLLRRKRMPYHIQKCSKNFNMSDFKVCPFNNRHVVHKNDFQMHLCLCQDKGVLEREMLFHREGPQQDNAMPVQKGYTDVPVSTFVPPEPEESWDDSNVRVDINPRGSLFSTQGHDAVEAVATSPQKRESRVRELPKTRDPVMTRGGDSEVFKLATTRVQEEPALLVGKARGRGRGRGTVIPGSPSNVGAAANGHYQQVSPEAAAAAVPRRGVGLGMGLGRGRGVTVQAPTAAQSDPEAEERKKARKLKKMLKQIFELQEKQENGQQLNEDQIAKLSRKEDILLMLEQLGQ